MKRCTMPRIEPLEGKALLSGLSYSLTTDATSYQAGQPVAMSFQETNVSDQAISVEDGPSIDGFDVSQGGRVIWRSNGGINPMFLRLETLQPGQSLTLTSTWDGKTNGGANLSPGTYMVSNQLNSGATASITIGNTPATASPRTPATSIPPPVIHYDPPPLPPPTTILPTSTTPSDPGTTASQASPIAVTVTTDHPSHRKGHKVHMTLTLRNADDSAVSLPINATEGFTVLQGSRTVWTTSRAVSGVGSVNLSPGQSVQYTATWNGRAHQAGGAVRPGTYTILGTAWGDEGTATFRIT